MAIKVHSTRVGFKNCAPFIICIIKIDVTTIDDLEYLDFFMPMYNLIEYKIISNQQEVYGFIQIMKQLTLIIMLWILINLNFLRIRLNQLLNQANGSL